MSTEVRRQPRYPWWKQYSLWIITESKKHDFHLEDESGLYTFLWFANLVKRKSATYLLRSYDAQQRIEIRKIKR